MSTIWKDLHNNYKNQKWIDKPSIFAEQAIKYFPNSGKLLELGAGQGQDSLYFAEKGFTVTSSDLLDDALKIAKEKALAKKLNLDFKKIDLRNELPFESEVFDIVYAHLSLHYFDQETTRRLIGEIQRILKPGGTLAFLVNSTNDPEYKKGQEIEPDYFNVGKAKKRYFNTNTARKLTQYFEINLLDSLGETYKDAEKGVHNLIRFIGNKPQSQVDYKMAIPYVGAIIERANNGSKEVLLSTRWKPHADPIYSGTYEFPAGVLDKPFENIFDTIAREIKEEVGLKLKTIKGIDKTKAYKPNGTDEIIAFRPFCCTQQLKGGKPWIGFVFVAEVEDAKPKSQLSETRDTKWVSIDEVKSLFKNTPEKFFGLELPAWQYYLNE